MAEALDEPDAGAAGTARVTKIVPIRRPGSVALTFASASEICAACGRS